MAESDKYIHSAIKGYGEDWREHNGAEVQEFLERMLKERVGHLHRTSEKEADGNFHLYGFSSEADCMEWMADPENNGHLIITDVTLPEGGGGSMGASYTLKLHTDSPTTIVGTAKDITVGIRFTSQEYDPITQTASDTGESGTLTIQTSTNGTTWTTRKTMEIESEASDSTEYRQIDLSPYLTGGSQQVRLMVAGHITGITTRAIKYNITVTDLTLAFASNWETPINVNEGAMRLNYRISGAVSKTLHLLIDGERTYTRALGKTTYTETPLQVEITDTQLDAHKVLTHGVHRIEAWLTVDDTSVETAHVHSEVMVRDAASTDRNPYVILNDVAERVDNWAQALLFSYAVFSPDGSRVPMKMSLGDSTLRRTYMTFDHGDVAPGTRQSVQTMVEIDSEEKSFDAYVHFQSGEETIHSKLKIGISNTESFAPTGGADFIFNPRLRSNEESEPRRIVNSARNGETVPSKWEGMSLTTDGYVDDEDGNRCLRVNAGSQVTIDYETLQDFIGTNNHSSATVEFDLRTRNATDMRAAALRCCSYMSDGLPVGFELRPDEMAFLTVNNRTYIDQNAGIDEGVRTHVAFAIIYNADGTGMNYVKLYINGRMNREFEWEPTDTFVRFVDGEQTSLGIRIGSDSCDIDIHGIRAYRRALSAQEIHRDYTASLPTIAQKLEERLRNDICDDSGRISRDRAEAAGYNTLTWIGRMPSYQTGNVKFRNDIRLHRHGDPEHSGTISNVDDTGQGTSSRGYFHWNQQDKDTEETRFVDENGTDHGSSVDVFPGLPVATKRVAKINYASSMQSHKMGSCRAYHDLYRAIVGDTYVSKTKGYENTRMAVYQEPFLGFHQETADAEPEFCGLYTYGAGKGDKPTFGYDKKAFPDYVIFEGSDNGTPLTGFQIPWNADVTAETNTDGDTFVMYNGGKQFELCLGDATRTQKFDILKETCNFLYLHSTAIKPFAGTVEELRAATGLDRTQMHFVTEASGEADRFDLFRYSDLTGTWVEGGIAKIAEGKYETMNLAEQSGLTPSSTKWESVCEQFRNWRRADFLAHHRSKGHILKQGALFHHSYTVLDGLSDNWKKNTYMFLDFVDGEWLWTFDQDDTDTRAKTNNVGRLTKPYWVEPGDTDEKGLAYWNGTDNVLWTLIGESMGEELRAMTNRILSEMADLSDDGSVMGFYEKYFFSTQEYFPAVAYNETARILYETAAQSWKEGRYSAPVHPMVQSLGDQLQCERAWQRKRILYMSSYASFGQFVMNGPGPMSWRAATTTEGTEPEFNFRLTPHMALYPAVSSGSSTYWGAGKAAPQRVMEGETYELLGVPGNNDQVVELHAIDLYREIGDFSDKSVNTTFTICGERLTRFSAKEQPMQFRPDAIIVTARNLRWLDLGGCTAPTGVLDLSMCTRLEQLDLTGTNFTAVILPGTHTLKEARLGARLTSLELRNLGGLRTLTIEGVAHMESLTMANCPEMTIGIAGEGKTLSRLMADDCGLDPIELINTHFAESNLTQVRLTGIDVTQGSAFLRNLMENGTRGLDSNGNPLPETGRCTGISGRWILTDLVTDTALAEMKGYFPNLELHNCQFSALRFTDPEPNPANISCDENKTGYSYGNLLEPEGHFKRIIEECKVYRCRYNEATKTMSLRQLSDSTYRKYADGTDYDPTDAAGVGYDVMKRVTPIWLKGVNDYKTGEKYIFVNSYGDGEEPMPTAKTVRRMKLSECLVKEDAAYIVDGVKAGDLPPEPSTSSGGTSCYRAGITEGMRQVRFPGVTIRRRGRCSSTRKDRWSARSSATTPTRSSTCRRETTSSATCPQERPRYSSRGRRVSPMRR